MMKEALTSKYNKLLSFRHEEVIILNLERIFNNRVTVHLDYSYTYFFRPQISSTQKD